MNNPDQDAWLKNDPLNEDDPTFRYITSQAECGVALNVFFVWHIRFPGDDDDVTAETVDGNCIFARNVSPSSYPGGVPDGFRNPSRGPSTHLMRTYVAR
jgi:hypothetical protein